MRQYSLETSIAFATSSIVNDGALTRIPALCKKSIHTAALERIVTIAHFLAIFHCVIAVLGTSVLLHGECQTRNVSDKMVHRMGTFAEERSMDKMILFSALMFYS